MRFSGALGATFPSLSPSTQEQIVECTTSPVKRALVFAISTLKCSLGQKQPCLSRSATSPANCWAFECCRFFRSALESSSSRQHWVVQRHCPALPRSRLCRVPVATLRDVPLLKRHRNGLRTRLHSGQTTSVVPAALLHGVPNASRRLLPRREFPWTNSQQASLSSPYPAEMTRDTMAPHCFDRFGSICRRRHLRQP